MADWNAEQYLKFEQERTLPSKDLIQRIALDAPQRIIDIGCGPGNSTAALYARFPRAWIMGIDNSPAMIETAAAQYPHLHFQLCDAACGFDGLGSAFDLVFSNACIQWVPDHPALLRNMMGLLRPGGVLAVQTPMNYAEPIHQIIGEVAGSARWKKYFDSPRIFYNLKPAAYFDLLSEIASDFQMWTTTYYHRMPSHQSIMEWYRGTGLRPYLNALDREQRACFEAEIFREVQKAYPVQANGEVIFRFPRLFFTAVK